MVILGKSGLKEPHVDKPTEVLMMNHDSKIKTAWALILFAEVYFPFFLNAKMIISHQAKRES